MSLKNEKIIHFESLLLVLIMAIITSGCSNRHQGNIIGKEPPENEIILIKRYVNYAEGYTEYGWFVDSNGEVYTYDFSTYDYTSVPANTDKDMQKKVFYDQLKSIKESTKPVAKVEKELIQNIYQEGMQIDVNAKLSEECVGCDMGQNIKIFHNTDTNELIIFNETGDIERIMCDKHAEKLTDYMRNIELKKLPD